MLELGDGSLSTLIFQHDNDPKHTSHKCRDYLKKWPNVMEWVAQSPDLNPIENLWAELERRLRARPMRATSKGDLFNVLKEEAGTGFLEEVGVFHAPSLRRRDQGQRLLDEVLRPRIEEPHTKHGVLNTTQLEKCRS